MAEHQSFRMCQGEGAITGREPIPRLFAGAGFAKGRVVAEPTASPGR